ncbi:SMP-30/gluconolactonase/LRE family protein [Paraglaciecola hydrolytica]|uniref:SMP-30/gluconolactonase/LRE family protein n=1 Tax=Paraglaciecola hydrolytica TaxID=1799789 RepID=UPI000B171101|nr:SMP-30/gluconolactonase/LRE family protein [Paraglaciecola hydrolytica]
MRFQRIIFLTLIATLPLLLTSVNAATDEHIKTSKTVSPHIEILDAKALTLLDPQAKVSIRSEGHTWTEGPLWIEEGAYLLFSDIPNNVIQKYDPNSGTSVYLKPAGATGLVAGDDGQGSNGLLLNHKGELVLFQQGDRRVAIMNAAVDAPLAKFSSMASDYQGKRLNSPNDGVFHSNGNLYFTDPPYGLKNGMRDTRKQLAFQGVYLLKTDGSLILLDDAVSFPNGIALTKDEKTLIVAVSDSQQAQWLAYDVKADGSLQNKRVFFDATSLVGKPGEQGLPDGLAVHSNGVIFATGPGGVWLFSEEGKVLAKIRTGQISSNCTLTTDEKTLYITADDYLLSVPLR